MEHYFKLCKEIHRSFLIAGTAPIISCLSHTFKIMTGRSWEDYKSAEAKFKKSIFADPASTGRTLHANPEIAEEIATFAHGG